MCPKGLGVRVRARVRLGFRGYKMCPKGLGVRVRVRVRLGFRGYKMCPEGLGVRVRVRVRVRGLGLGLEWGLELTRCVQKMPYKP
eukprot:1365906-Amorphochlora_amoeboformis.AAC.1